MRNRQGCEESGMMRDLTGIARLAANFAAIVAAFEGRKRCFFVKKKQKTL